MAPSSEWSTVSGFGGSSCSPPAKQSISYDPRQMEKIGLQSSLFSDVEVADGCCADGALNVNVGTEDLTVDAVNRKQQRIIFIRINLKANFCNFN